MYVQCLPKRLKLHMLNSCSLDYHRDLVSLTIQQLFVEDKTVVSACIRKTEEVVPGGNNGTRDHRSVGE